MSQRDNFSGGFVLGAIFGGVVGGILGATLVSRQLGQGEGDGEDLSAGLPEAKATKGRSFFKPPTEQGIEAARQGLEDKIAQLNDAIDDVRQQLSNVNHNGIEVGGERALAKDP
ncbi:MAG: hypothetical protein KME16_18630 [Scytolyngbya sp. HA4215-MV1]|jgi:hypothetical protein|nr:hypothetical protein [Scytolyngbya sp. HA4215-MV1]